MFFQRLIGLTALMLLVTRAPADGLFGPVLGLLPDPRAGAVRPIRGIPGAATIGDPVDVGTDVTGIAVTPRQSSALLMTDAGSRVASVAADGTVSAVDAGLPPGFHPAVVSFSPTGLTAALYDPATKQLWLRTDSARQLDISQLPSTIDRLAVSDRTDIPIAGTFRDDSHSVFAMDATGGWKQLSGFDGVTDVTFLGATGDLAIADGRAEQVLLVRDPASGNAPDLLLEIAGAPNMAMRIASSSDGKVIAVLAAARASQRPSERSAGASPRHPTEANPVLGLLRVADRLWSPVECGCAPVGLTPLKGNSVYRLTESLDQPVWMLDGDAEPARVVFVPAVQK